MRKKAFTLLLALVAIVTTAQAQVVLNETNFPDANFRAALAEKLGISEGEEITGEKIAATAILNVSKKNIAVLTGIEFFTELTTLYCYSNQLTSLDVSKNTSLTRLHCRNNKLTLINVAGCTALKELDCDINQIKSKAMDALVNDLPTVDDGYIYVIHTKNEKEGNICTKAHVSIAKKKGWKIYDRASGQEYEGSNTVMPVMLNSENFPDMNFRKALAYRFGINEGEEITEEKIEAMINLFVNGISIRDLTGIEYFTVLTKLDCSNNQLTSLDVSKNTALTELDCAGNLLTSLDVSKNTALENLSCSNNQLTSLNVSENTILTSLSCNVNKLNSLDMSACAALKSLECSGNLLTTLNISKNTELEQLYCNENQLTSLYVSKNIALKTLNCSNNKLTSLDVSGLTSLSWLYCLNNKITMLDVSECIELKSLNCYMNQIKNKTMDALVNSLPIVNGSSFHVIDTKNEKEGNICTKEQVWVAKLKGWTVYDGGGFWQEYEGSDDSTGIDSLLNDSRRIKNDNWYSINGAKLNIESTKSGLYIHHGKKIVK